MICNYDNNSLQVLFMFQLTTCTYCYSKLLRFQLTTCDACQWMNWKLTRGYPRCAQSMLKLLGIVVGIDFIGPQRQHC